MEHLRSKPCAASLTRLALLIAVIATGPAPGDDRRFPADGGSIDFENEPLRTVAASILGEILGESYSIAPDVQGSATIFAPRPVPAEMALALLDQALAENNAQRIETDGRHDIVPAGRPMTGGLSAENGRAARPPAPIRVVPLKFISVDAMVELLEPYARAGAVVAVDVTRNLIAISGTPREIGAYLQTIETFDVEWLAGMAIEVFPIRSGSAATMAAKLETLFAGGGRLRDAGPYRFVPLERARTIVAIASREALLERIRPWLELIDQNGDVTELRSYELAHIRAAELVGPLSDVLGGSSGTIRVAAAEENNSILLRAGQGDWPSIRNAIRKLDGRPRQVHVDVKVAQVDFVDELGLGIVAHLRSEGVISADSVPGSAPGFAWTLENGGVSALIEALELVADVRLLDGSSIQSLGNIEARTGSGLLVPLPSVLMAPPTDGSLPPPTYLQTGNTLEVETRAAGDSMIFLDIVQNLSIPLRNPASGPTFQLTTRRVSTSVHLRDGETVVLAGLSQDISMRGSGPGAGQSPHPFSAGATSSRRRKASRRETLVLLTPTIVPDLDGARELTDEYLRNFEALTPMGSPPR